MQSSNDDFVLPDGSLFDTNVGLGNDLQAQPFRAYERFLSKTKERLSLYGRRPENVQSFNHIGAEVGDDEIGVSDTPVYPAAELTVFSEFLGVKVSEEDTSINPRFGNFAEDLVMIPDGYEQTYRYCRQTSDFRNMAFLDVPKLRLAIDIRPGRMSHSATNDGKAGMLGSRLAWLPRSSPVRCIWEVFNLFQDINLGLIRDKKFSYLPTALGGYGKPIPFGHTPNFEAFCVRYKQGAHAGLARELVRRTNARFKEYTLDHRFSTDAVLSAVSRIQSSWHDWIKGKSLYAPTCWLEAPPEVAKFRVAKQGTDVRLDGALRLLQSTGHLVSENDLAIAYEHNKLCEFLLNAENYNDFVARREASRKEWINLSTFSMRFYNLIVKLDIDPNKQSELLRHEYDEFWYNITRSRINLRSFLRQENFYDKAAKDFIYNCGPMMVRFPLFPEVTQMGRRYWYEPVTDRMDDTESPEEFAKLLEWVKSDPLNTNPPSTKVVEDDPFIIKEISMGSYSDAYCIVTDDVKLCREAYKLTRRWVCRIPTKWYYMSVYYGDADSPWLKELSTKFPIKRWNEIQDTGSIESYEEIGFRDGLPILFPAERPLNMVKPSFKQGGGRIRAQRTFPDQEENPEWRPDNWPDGYLFGTGSFLLKKKHPFKRGWA